MKRLKEPYLKDCKLCKKPAMHAHEHSRWCFDCLEARRKARQQPWCQASARGGGSRV